MPESADQLPQRFTTFAGLAGMLAAVAGTLVLMGWWLNVEMLTSLASGLASMKANTALCFILAGISLWLQRTDSLSHESVATATRDHAAQALGAVVALIGLLTLLEYLANINLGIDELLLPDPGTPLSNPAGRMAPVTAINFLVLGSALALARSERLPVMVERCSLLVLISGFIAMLGHLYDVEALYRIGPYTSMALHTAVVFVILACGSLASRPTRGFMKTLTSPSAGGIAARRMLPWVVLAPILLGWLRLLGQREGLYGTEFGLTLFAVSSVIILAVVVHLSARALNADDAARKHAEELLLGQNLVLQQVVAGASLPDTLDALLRLVESQSPGLLTSILLLDDTGLRLHHGAAPSLPADYCRGLDGMAVGPAAGSCGTAAYRREPVIVTDIQADPLWANYRELAGHIGVRACWSTPIIGANGRVLGTFAMYYRLPSVPEPRHTEIINLVTQTAILTIEHQYALDAIRAGELRYRTLGDNMPDVVARYDRELRFLYVNRAVEAAAGIPAEQFPGKTFAELGMPQAQIEFWSASFRRVFATGSMERIEYDYPAPGGTRYWEALIVAERNRHNEIESVLTISRDVTERKWDEAKRAELEAQLRQTHKLQALGTLAGGIAHDFNNMLMVIGGNAALAHTKVPAGHPIHGHLGEIEKASGRAAQLVTQILAFSRPQVSQRSSILLKPIIDEALQLLRSTVPATIRFRARYDPVNANVLADPTQVHQVLINLCTNAAHAMRERGGTLEVSLESIRVDAALPRSSPDLHEGLYERVTVTDTGTGMDAATLERIFDPFYTTKGVGEGTGLGLSVSHGIMRGHGGAITVTSRPGHGTTFSLYFPATGQTSPESIAPETAAPVKGRRERVLFVDDEESLVLLIARVLEPLNYQVTCETDPHAALATFTARPQDFDVLVTDLAMPGMSGFDLVRAILKIRPDLPVIMTTGYVRPEDTDEARRLGIKHLILKPNTVAELGKVLEQLFGGQA